MIRINRDGNVTLLSAAVTDFSDSMGYCEYKVPLSIKGVRPEPSQALMMGSAAHDAEEKYEQEHVEFEPVTIQEIEDEKKDIEFARENIYSTLVMPFTFSNEKVLISLSGRIDKIMRVDETLVIHDDKFVRNPHTYDKKTHPYPGQLLQVIEFDSHEDAMINNDLEVTRKASEEDTSNFGEVQFKNLRTTFKY